MEKYPNIFTQAVHMLEFGAKDSTPLWAPIGEYGEEWARRLIYAYGTLIHAACDKQMPTNIRKEGIDIGMIYEGVLDKYTYNKMEEQTTVAEGFQSVLLVAGFFTMYKVSGYEEEPERLLSDLADQHIFSRFALTIPPAVTNIMSHRGGVFTAPAISREDKKLIVRSDIVEHFSKERSGEYKNETTFAKLKLERRGCPVARKLPGNTESGVDMAARLFAQTVASQKVK